MSSALPPKPFEKGLGHQALNERFEWTWEHLLESGDNFSYVIPGVNGRPGKLFIRAGVVSAAQTHPWQLARSPWRGVGADPYRADGGDNTRKMRVRFIVPGDVNGEMPANMFTEFLCFGDPDDLEIEGEDAVWTTFAVRDATSESELGNGLTTFGAPTIITFEGPNLSDFIDSSALTWPDDGSMPANAYKVIARAAYWGGVLHIYQGVDCYLDINVVASGLLNCGTLSRQFQWTRTLSGG